MSFSEFSYPLLQAWDWWVLFKNGVQVQVGGTDQYGNILFGMESVKAISKNTAMEQERDPLENDIDNPIGLTTPLLTAPNGEKFGKSAGNAIWLDKDMTSTFELYQVCSVVGPNQGISLTAGSFLFGLRMMLSSAILKCLLSFLCLRLPSSWKSKTTTRPNGLLSTRSLQSS